MNFSLFEKPSRYIDAEVNAARKDAPVGVCLAFPDTYEVGMSHLGLKILYHIINSLPHARAERAFYPWLDMERHLRATGEPLCSLEAGMPLKDFDVVGISLQYELSFTSALGMLELGGIPIYREERKDTDPIVIAGGPCTVNPMPVSPFFDAFVVGDAEESIVEILDAVRAWKTGGGRNRHEIIKALADIEGVYAPSIGKPARRRIVEDLDGAPYPTKPVLPYVQIVHDRVNIEISRGCPMGCRYCQAGMIYRPMRERSPERILEIARESLRATGYEEVSFTSLSAGDYSCLNELLREFQRRFQQDTISLSLPSLRVKAVNEEALEIIKSVKKTGFTIAPEAGTERLRSVINKDFTDADYGEALRRLFSQGWLNLKLYFMIGLPTETQKDVEAIPEMARRAIRASKEHTNRFVNISASVNPFVPKPHTPFQWKGQEPRDVLEEKLGYLRGALRKCRMKTSNLDMNVLEAAFARGDDKLSGLLVAAYREGARLDGWTEALDMRAWQRAMEKTGLDINHYATRDLDPGEPLPWDVIDSGIEKDFLIREYARAMDGKTSPECRTSCMACGLGCEKKKTEAPSFRAARNPSIQAPRTRKPVTLRAEFSKTGVLRYLSHRELMNSVTRAIRRAGIRMEYSKGFSPSPLISFGPPLGVGVAGLGECFDIELSPAVTMEELKQRINVELPEGLRIHAFVPAGTGAESLQSFVTRYEYEIIWPDGSAVADFMAKEGVIIQREKGPVDIRPMVASASFEAGKIKLALADTGEKKVRLDEIMLKMLGHTHSELDIVRTGIFGDTASGLKSPMEAPSYPRPAKGKKS